MSTNCEVEEVHHQTPGTSATLPSACSQVPLANSPPPSLGKLEKDRLPALLVGLVVGPIQLRDCSMPWRATSDGVGPDGQAEDGKGRYPKLRHGVAAGIDGIDVRQAVFWLGKSCPHNRNARAVVTV